MDPEAPKDVLCHQIKLITQADPDMVKQSTITRQQVRIRSDIAYINQFDNGELPPDIKCGNKSLLSANMYDFPDVDIAYYRDYQDNLWCFTSNNFSKMLDKEVNPYTTELFPQWFLEDVGRKIDFISKYRNMEDDPTPISVVLDNLNLPDTINNIYSDNDILRLNQILIEKGITEYKIENLSIDDMKKILVETFQLPTNLDNINKEHGKVTFLVVSYQELSNNPDLTSKYVNLIEEQISNKNK